MKMKKLSLLTLLMLGLFIVACSDGEDPDPEPEPEVCETMGMRYDTTMRDILNTNCATAGCHEPGTNTFPMHNWDAAKAAVSFGRISGAINHEAGFSPMPRGMDKLDQCTIDQIDSWLDDGAPW